MWVLERVPRVAGVLHRRVQHPRPQIGLHETVREADLLPAHLDQVELARPRRGELDVDAPHARRRPDVPVDPGEPPSYFGLQLRTGVNVQRYL
jgi:hypothetical protein